MEITAWRNQEATLVDPYSNKPIYFIKVRNIVHQALVYPWPYRIARSHNGALWAVRLGYKNVYRHPGGIKAWDEADYPVAKVE